MINKQKDTKAIRFGTQLSKKQKTARKKTKEQRQARRQNR